MLLAIILFAVQSAPAFGTPAEQGHLIGATIDELRSHIESPDSVSFRRVHLRTGIGADGRRHLTLCGQMIQDDPRVPPGWQMFGSANVGTRVMVIVGNTGTLENAAIWCRTGASDVWDDRDLAERFQRELGQN